MQIFFFSFFYEYLSDLCFCTVFLRGSISLFYLVIAHLAAITSEMTLSSSVLRVNVEEQMSGGHLLLLQVGLDDSDRM